MTHLDSHMERALAGNASDSELAELKEHTRTCAACAALLELGPQVASRVSETPANAERDERMVQRALSAAPHRPAARRTATIVGLSLAAILLGSGAAAQYLGVTLPWSSTETASEPAPVVAVTPQPPRPPSVKRQPVIADKVPKAPESKPETIRQPKATAPPQTPSSLFSEANQLRRSGQDAQAIAAYRRLQRTFPGSHEALLSHATLGSLLLSRGDGQGALAQFNRYVARGGPVLEEALAGRARALASLGDRAGELRAWQTLLKRFPGSVHAAKAQTRIKELR